MPSSSWEPLILASNKLPEEESMTFCILPPGAGPQVRTPGRGPSSQWSEAQMGQKKPCFSPWWGSGRGAGGCDRVWDLGPQLRVWVGEGDQQTPLWRGPQRVEAETGRQPQWENWVWAGTQQPEPLGDPTPQTAANPSPPGSASGSESLSALVWASWAASGRPPRGHPASKTISKLCMTWAETQPCPEPWEGSSWTTPEREGGTGDQNQPGVWNEQK